MDRHIYVSIFKVFLIKVPKRTDFHCNDMAKNGEKSDSKCEYSFCRPITWIVNRLGTACLSLKVSLVPSKCVRWIQGIEERGKVSMTFKRAHEWMGKDDSGVRLGVFRQALSEWRALCILRSPFKVDVRGKCLWWQKEPLKSSMSRGQTTAPPKLLSLTHWACWNREHLVTYFLGIRLQSQHIQCSKLTFNLKLLTLS